MGKKGSLDNETIRKPEQHAEFRRQLEEWLHKWEPTRETLDQVPSRGWIRVVDITKHPSDNDPFNFWWRDAVLICWETLFPDRLVLAGKALCVGSPVSWCSTRDFLLLAMNVAYGHHWNKWQDVFKKTDVPGVTALPLYRVLRRFRDDPEQLEMEILMEALF